MSWWQFAAHNWESGKTDSSKSEGSSALDPSQYQEGQPKPHLLSSKEFIAEAKKHFSEFDKNHDGFLTYDELAEQVENKNNKGETAQFVAALYGSRKTLREMNNDTVVSSTWLPVISLLPGASILPGLHEPDGVSMKDLNNAESLIQQKTNDTNNPYSIASVQQFDADKDGNLSKTELQTALQSRKLPKDEAELFQYYLNNNDSSDVVKVTDVLTYFTKNDMGDEADKFMNKIDMILNRAYEAQTNRAGKLFGESKDGKDGVNIYGVSQGTLGDCYFMASLGAVAHHSPDTIRNMIKENRDGTYTVTFPGAKDEPITVQPITEAERGIFTGAADHGEWAAVIEKGYGTYCQKHFWRRTPKNMSGGNLPAEGADGGGMLLDNLMNLLTGKGTTQDWLANPVPLLHWVPTGDPDALVKAKLYAAVGSNQEHKVPTVAWQKPWNQTAVSDVTNHVYSVLDYNPAGGDGGTLTLYNPWGHKEAISFKQFSERFMSVAYQTER